MKRLPSYLIHEPYLRVYQLRPGYVPRPLFWLTAGARTGTGGLNCSQEQELEQHYRSPTPLTCTSHYDIPTPA